VLIFSQKCVTFSYSTCTFISQNGIPLPILRIALAFEVIDVGHIAQPEFDGKLRCLLQFYFYFAEKWQMLVRVEVGNVGLEKVGGKEWWNFGGWEDKKMGGWEDWRMGFG